MKKEEKNFDTFLSDVINSGEIKEGCFNLIQTPPSSGKTTYCLTKLIEDKGIEKNKVLYLCALSEINKQITEEHKDKVAVFDKHSFNPDYYGGFGLNTNKVTCMCYEKLGAILYNELMYNYDILRNKLDKDLLDFLDNFDLIICDEFHDLDWRIAASLQINGDYQLTMNGQAVEAIKAYTKYRQGLVVGITATPKKSKLTKYFERKNLLNDIYVDPTPWTVDIEEEIVTDNIESEIKQACRRNDPEEKVLLYTKTIRQEKRYKEIIESMGETAIVLHSANNNKHKLDKEQKAALEDIRHHRKLSGNYKFVIINKAFELGIKLEDIYKTIIIDVADGDTIVQVMGRLRRGYINTIIVKGIENLNNIEYANIKHAVCKIKGNNIEIDNSYLNTPLTSKDKKDLVEIYGGRDSQGRKRSWTKLKEQLENDGYEIRDINIRVDGKKTRMSIINKIAS